MCFLDEDKLLITKEMEEEERQMAVENAKEEEKIKKQYEEVGYIYYALV